MKAVKIVNDPNIRVFSDEFNVIDARAESHNILIYSQGNDECYTIMAANMPFLYTVEHDDTLLGTGRQGDPLRMHRGSGDKPLLAWSAESEYLKFRIYKMGDIVFYKYEVKKDPYTIPEKIFGPENMTAPYFRAYMKFSDGSDGINCNNTANLSADQHPLDLKIRIPEEYRTYYRIGLPLTTTGCYPYLAFEERYEWKYTDCLCAAQTFANNMFIETDGKIISMMGGATYWIQYFPFCWEEHDDIGRLTFAVNHTSWHTVVCFMPHYDFGPYKQKHHKKHYVKCEASNISKNNARH